MSDVRRYQVLELLGKGGFGAVYRAELLGAGGFAKIVALKVLNADVESAPTVVERLRDEARMLAKLKHRAILQVDGLIRLGDRWAIVMEYVEGVSLSHVLSAEKRIDPRLALAICAQVASGLATAFSRPVDGVALGLLHRDVKPANIQVTVDGDAKLLDFGIARAQFATREALTRSEVLGSVLYAAPERFEFEDVHQGDVYSLTATLFELVVGEPLGRASANPPRHAERVAGAVERMKAAGIEPAVIDFVVQGLASKPTDRPDARRFEQRAMDLVARLEGPDVGDWARVVVPRLRAQRAVQPDGLVGTTLAESGPVVVPPAPRRGSPVARVVVLALALTGLVAIVTGTLAGGGALAGVGCLAAGGGFLFSSPAQRSIDGLVDEARRQVPATDPNREALIALISKMHRDIGHISYVEYSAYRSDLQTAERDRKITDEELDRLKFQYEQLLID